MAEESAPDLATVHSSSGGGGGARHRLPFLYNQTANSHFLASTMVGGNFKLGYSNPFPLGPKAMPSVKWMFLTHLSSNREIMWNFCIMYMHFLSTLIFYSMKSFHRVFYYRGDTVYMQYMQDTNCLCTVSLVPRRILQYILGGYFMHNIL